MIEFWFWTWSHKSDGYPYFWQVRFRGGLNSSYLNVQFKGKEIKERIWQLAY